MSGRKIGGRVRLRGFFTVLATLIIPLIAVSCASTKVDGSGEGSSESVSIAKAPVPPNTEPRMNTLGLPLVHAVVKVDKNF